MKRVAEANETCNAPCGVELVGQQARHASAHGLAADHQHLTVAQPGSNLLDGRAILRDEQLRLRWGLALAARPACGHVDELETRHGYVARSEQIRHGLEKGARHWSACAVRQHEPHGRILGTGVEKLSHSYDLHSERTNTFLTWKSNSASFRPSIGLERNTLGFTEDNSCGR